MLIGLDRFRNQCSGEDSRLSSSNPRATESAVQVSTWCNSHIVTCYNHVSTARSQEFTEAGRRDNGPCQKTRTKKTDAYLSLQKNSGPCRKHARIILKITRSTLSKTRACRTHTFQRTCFTCDWSKLNV